MPTTQQIAQEVRGRLVGDGSLPIQSVASLDEAAPGQITFLRDLANDLAWQRSRASAALVPESFSAAAQPPGRAVILTSDVDLALIRVLELFAPPLDRPPLGIDPGAWVDPSASIALDASIAPGCRIGPGVRIGPRSILHAGAVLMAEVVIGSDTEIHPGVVIRDRCLIGDRVIIHPNAVIGADGFGYHPSPDGKALLKVPHIGIVRIGHDVEIGAGTCIDRAKFGATEIGDGCKIDNLCQIAHNCRLGRCCVLAGQVGLAGSVTLGDGVVMGGKVAVKDHISIGAGAMLAACSAVMDDIPPGAKWGGYPAQDARVALREHAAIRKLPELVRELQKELKAGRAQRDPQPR